MPAISQGSPTGDNKPDRNDDVNEFGALGPMTSFLEIQERFEWAESHHNIKMVLRADIRYAVQLEHLQ